MGKFRNWVLPRFLLFHFPESNCDFASSTSLNSVRIMFPQWMATRIFAGAAGGGGGSAILGVVLGGCNLTGSINYEIGFQLARGLSSYMRIPAAGISPLLKYTGID